MDHLELAEIIKTYEVVEKIIEGRSRDEKYKLKKGADLFLLRIGDRAKASEKKKEYDRLYAYAGQDINTHKPIAFGIAGDKFYSIVSWVEGTPVMDIIKRDLSKNYYELGKKAGMELKKLHSACQSDSKIEWKEIIEKKAAAFLENYHRRNIAFACSKEAEQYILENLRLMSERPQTRLHGDFHWNNCVIDERGKAGIIDFSGDITGDPWYEFGGLLWAWEYSTSFVKGQIDGYFDRLPDNFWKIFKFYTALYAFEHFSYGNGTPEDDKIRIFNAGRMLKIFGEHFELEQPYLV